MKLFKFNDNTVQGVDILCEAKNTRSGFKHVATLFIDGREYDSAKICYQNRTWERYPYESVLLKLIDKTTSLTPDERSYIRKELEHYA